MKIIALHASPRGNESKTLQLAQAVLDGARMEGADTMLVDIYKLDIGYCNACGTCYATGECTLIDDFPGLFEQMMNAEGIVFSAPNYIDSVPAPMKAVFDRVADAIHCQMFFNKYGCSVSTAGGQNYGVVVDYMNQVLTSLGATVVGGVGTGLGHDPEAIKPAIQQARQLGRTLAQSIRGEHSYPAQDEIHRQKREYFCQLVKFNKEKFAHEYDWYVEMGWMK